MILIGVGVVVVGGWVKGGSVATGPIIHIKSDYMYIDSNKMENNNMILNYRL